MKSSTSRLTSKGDERAVLEVSCHEPPLTADLQAELPPFWEQIFEEEFGFRDVLAGSDEGLIGHKIYLERDVGSSELRGTAHLAYSEPGETAASPSSGTSSMIGGVGEVATAPEFRRRGVAAQLCEMVRDEFARQDGAALFLGTGNPAAARVYRRLGFRKLASAQVMAQVNVGESPEGFLAGHFATDESIEVRSGSPRSRCHLIPLAVCPHDWQVMDSNAGLYSTRHTLLTSCMGLFPRYEGVTTGEREGTWFEGWTESGRCLAGMSTARLVADGISQVDGFIHGHYAAEWSQLLTAAVDWSRERASHCRVEVSVEDEDKQAWFEQLGFTTVAEGSGFEIGGRSVVSRQLEMTL